MDVQGGVQSGLKQLQAITKLDIGVLTRYAMYSREQQSTQHGGKGNGMSTEAELATWVEFNKDYQ